MLPNGFFKFSNVQFYLIRLIFFICEKPPALSMGKFHWKLRFTVLVLMVKSGYGLASRAELANSKQP